VWQRDATRHLATGRAAEAINAYVEHDAVHVAATREQARADLIDRWDRERQTSPDASRIILTHTNAEVRELNISVRDRLRLSDALGDDVTVATERGERPFAPGDRIMFLKNERGLGVKNGSLGNVQSVTATRMAVMLDDARAVAFDIKDYAAVDHGYAATIHKTQGVTVDRAHVLATPGLDRHAAYVALSRHRDGVDLHYSSDDFADRGKLVAALSRARAKDMASDYARDFAERRQIHSPMPASDKAKIVPVRDPFAGLKLRSTVPAPAITLAPVVPARQPEPSAELQSAVIRHAKVVSAILYAARIEEPLTAEQRQELAHSRNALDKLGPHHRQDLETAFLGDKPALREAEAGRPAVAIRAMQFEAEIRVDPIARADAFVQRWQALERRRRSYMEYHEDTNIRRVSDRLFGMAKGLERDPQVESILRNRKIELGLSPMSSRGVGQELADIAGRGRGRGLGIGM
jgi:hypothetical protein